MKEAKKKLEEQIKLLGYELSEELPAALKKAIAMGDLRENAEYQTAKERQSYVQAQLANLRKRLADLSMIDLRKIPKDRISYGSIVLLFNFQNYFPTFIAVILANYDLINYIINQNTLLLENIF